MSYGRPRRAEAQDVNASKLPRGISIDGAEYPQEMESPMKRRREPDDGSGGAWMASN